MYDTVFSRIFIISKNNSAINTTTKANPYVDILWQP